MDPELLLTILVNVAKEIHYSGKLTESMRENIIRLLFKKSTEEESKGANDMCTYEDKNESSTLEIV